MNIGDFKNFINDNRIKWTTHGLARMQERDISIKDVISCILTGEIIEEYPEDYPNESALIFGRNDSGHIIHVVCGIDQEAIYIITAYFPTSEKFEKDLKTRRIK
ncbi:MAG: DUF4258 domain-containing protein [Lachnospiraceae bacterium]|nr:DUF4258 domain-containing protein [Lachnospiraceae bacterium]